LKCTEGYFSALLKQFTNEKQNAGSDVENETSDLVKQSSSRFGFKSQKAMGKLIKKEQSETGRVRSAVYLEYLRKISLPLFSILILCKIIETIFSMASNLWLSRWSSSKTILDTQKTRYFLIIYAILAATQGKHRR